MPHIHPLASQVDAAQFQESLERLKVARLAREARRALQKAERRRYPDSGDPEAGAGDDSPEREPEGETDSQDGGFEAKA